MLAAMSWNWELDGWIVMAGVLCAVASSLLGCLLVLRRMSMLGDAISHAVLPGLAAAFLISNSRSSVWMFIGAVVAGVFTALLTEWIRGYGNVDEGASMGVVFTTLFALGLVMIVQAADHVDLDAGCVLYGAIELTPLDRWQVIGFEVPRVVVILSIVSALNLLFVVVFFKELKLSAFDPVLATTSGFSASLMHYLLMTLVAITAVASFESVGNILVLAMMVVPPATALMLTDRLVRMIALSVLIGALAATFGHIAAIQVPTWFGYRSTSTAGMMAVVAGLFFLVAALFAPRHGILVKLARLRVLSIRILCEDILALLYRQEERKELAGSTVPTLRRMLFSSGISTRIAVIWERFNRRVTANQGSISLTEKGRSHAIQLIRSHRLWEHYLVDTAGIPAQRIHESAERLEHYTGQVLRERLDQETESPSIDPHGRPIPGNSSE